MVQTRAMTGPIEDQEITNTKSLTKGINNNKNPSSKKRDVKGGRKSTVKSKC